MSKEKTILIADDEERNVKLLRLLCERLNYKTIVAANGQEAVEKCITLMPDIILMDVMMPVMNGFDATERIKANAATHHIPVIILTALDSREDMLKGIEKGANDFLRKPIDAKELILRVKNHLRIKEYHDFLKDHNQILEQEVAQRTQDLREAFEVLAETHKTVRSGYIETIYRLTLAAEYKDNDTGSHLKRISSFTQELSSALGMDGEFRDSIFYASPMHDVGKVGIPDSILLKPDKLTREEWDVMKTHTLIGAKILGRSKALYLKMSEAIALSHHERWDGGGYPNGLKGEEIPLAARIMNIADQYDALRSRRPYKDPFTHEEAVAIITKGDGRTMPGHFDPQVLDAFIRSVKMFQEIYESLSE